MNNTVLLLIIRNIKMTAATAAAISTSEKITKSEALAFFHALVMDTWMDLTPALMDRLCGKEFFVPTIALSSHTVMFSLYQGMYKATLPWSLYNETYKEMFGEKVWAMEAAYGSPYGNMLGEPPPPFIQSHIDQVRSKLADELVDASESNLKLKLYI